MASTIFISIYKLILIMGKIKDFVGWLSEGKGNTKDGLSHSVMKIKLFVKRL